jgi:DNA-binding CsgD family transcriptional regulator
MVGRNAELAAVEQGLEGVGSRFAMIAICGEPGIGKTTIWRYGIAAAQARGYQVVQCRPAESETWLSFSGLADLMEDVPGQLPEALPCPQREALEGALLKRASPQTDGDCLAILAAVTSLIRAMADTSPVVVAVDDLQWLDASTAAVLAYLARRITGAPVLLLVTAQNDPGQPLPGGLDQAFGSERVLHLPLGPLSAGEMYEVVRDGTEPGIAWPELLRLHEASAGNPLLAIEIVKALHQSRIRPAAGEPLPVPGSIAAMIAARISALSAPTRDALLVASALARPTIGQISTAMNAAGERWAGTGAGPLDSAEDHGVVHISDGLVRFGHPLFSPAIYSSAPPARRRRVHRLLAGIVDDDEERAWHMALAVPGPDRQVAAALEQAARAAQERGAVPAAARLWELASRRTPAADPLGTAARTEAAAVCLMLGGDVGRARSMLEEVTEGMIAGRQRTRALLALATVLHFHDSTVAAAALCRRTLHETELARREAPEEDRLLQACLRLRAASFDEQDTHARVRDAEAAVLILDAGAATAGANVLACALAARGYYRFLAGSGIELADLVRARRMLSACDQSWEWAWTRYIGLQWTKSLDLGLAEAECRTMLRQAGERGDELMSTLLLFHLAEIECRLGRMCAAKAHAAEAAAGFERTGQRRRRGLAHYIEALPQACLGEVAAARAVAWRGLEIASSDDDWYVAALLLGLLGFIAITLGDFTEADRHLSRADELAASMGLGEPAEHRFHGDYLEALLARGELSRAAALQERLEERMRAAPYPWLKMIAIRGRAMLLAACGDLDAAADAAEQALREARAAAIPLEHARTLLAAGRIRRRRKEKLLAREAFEQAQQIFDTLPNPLWSAQVAAEIRRLCQRRASMKDLTTTEERVARLAASGHTNREIAGILHISEKTVEANLSRVYRKLGISSRRALTDSGISPHERR